MKKTAFILLFVSLLFYCGGPDLSTPQGLATSFLAALSSGDFDNLKPLLPSEDDVVQLLAQVKDSGALSPEQVVGFEKEMEDSKKEIPRILKQSKETFNRFMKGGPQEGINWRDVRFVKAEYKVKEEDNSGVTIKFADITVTFTHQEATYAIRLPECPLLPRGYLFSGDAKWLGKVKS